MRLRAGNGKTRVKNKYLKLVVISVELVLGHIPSLATMATDVNNKIR